MVEAVNHPSHYGGDVPHEVYKSDRLGENNKVQDLQKAVWYINNRIEQLKAEENGQNENR